MPAAELCRGPHQRRRIEESDTLLRSRTVGSSSRPQFRPGGDRSPERIAAKPNPARTRLVPRGDNPIASRRTGALSAPEGASDEGSDPRATEPLSMCLGSCQPARGSKYLDSTPWDWTPDQLAAFPAQVGSSLRRFAIPRTPEPLAHSSKMSRITPASAALTPRSKCDRRPSAPVTETFS